MRSYIIFGMSVLLAIVPAVAQNKRTPLIIANPNPPRTVGDVRILAFRERLLLTPALREKTVRRLMHILVKGNRPTQHELQVVSQVSKYCGLAQTPDYSPCVAARRILARR